MAVVSGLPPAEDKVGMSVGMTDRGEPCVPMGTHGRMGISETKRDVAGAVVDVLPLNLSLAEKRNRDVIINMFNTPP